MKDNDEDLDEIIEGNYEINEQEYNIEEFESHIYTLNKREQEDEYYGVS